MWPSAITRMCNYNLAQVKFNQSPQAQRIFCLPGKKKRGKEEGEEEEEGEKEEEEGKGGGKNEEKGRKTGEGFPSHDTGELRSF